MPNNPTQARYYLDIAVTPAEIARSAIRHLRGIGQWGHVTDRVLADLHRHDATAAIIAADNLWNVERTTVRVTFSSDDPDMIALAFPEALRV